MQTMTIRDLLKMNIDIDVCDDYDESCYIAYVGDGHYPLTREGETVFGSVLDIKCEVYEDSVILCTSTDNVWDEENGESARRTRMCKKLFYAIAGYCADSDFKKWFFSETDILWRYEDGEINALYADVETIRHKETYSLPHLTRDLSQGVGSVMMYFEWCPTDDCIYRYVSY